MTLRFTAGDEAPTMRVLPSTPMRRALGCALLALAACVGVAPTTAPDASAPTIDATTPRDTATPIDATPVDATPIDATQVMLDVTRALDAAATDAPRDVPALRDVPAPRDVPAAAPTYRNVVLDESGDPFCARFGDAYYLYLPDQVRRDGVGVGGRVLGFRSTDLVHWRALGEVFSNVGEAYGGQHAVGLWAPEVLEYDGRYYLYYVNVMSNPANDSVGDKDIVVIRSDDPADFHAGAGRTVLLDDPYAFIDPSPFRDPGRGAFGTGSAIMVRPLRSPTAFGGAATELVHSDRFPDAENVVEQPMMWRQGARYFLLLSRGSGSGTGYTIAYATSAQPTGPFASWDVLFQSDRDLGGDVSRSVISPGASSIVRDGADRTWLVYRQKTTTADTFADRGVCIDPITVDPATPALRGTPTRGVVRPGPTPLP
jgi:hypothetical protein